MPLQMTTTVCTAAAMRQRAQADRGAVPTQQSEHVSTGNVPSDAVSHVTGAFHD